MTLDQLRPTTAQTERWHGTVNGYTHKRCRCAQCRKAWAAAQSKYQRTRTVLRRAKKFLDDRLDPYGPFFNIKRLETMRVGLWAHRGRTPARVYTHTVAIAENGEKTPLCTRVLLENLFIRGEDGRTQPPSCPYCAAKVRKIPDAIRARLYSAGS